MRRVRLVPAVLLAAVTLAAAPVSPATAGGPTSVLLSVPGADSTTSLYYTDPQYDELADLVGVSQPDGTFAADSPAAPSGQRGAGVTLTWLIHDVEPWRVDRIVLAKDGPWISTQIWSGTRSLARSPIVWHRPADPAGLVSLLGRLGLDTKAAQEPGFEGVAGAPAPEPPTASEPAPTAGEPAAAAPSVAASSWTHGAGWALAGLAGGLLIALALVRLVPLRRRRSAPDAEPVSTEPVGVAAEVLVR